MKDVKYSYSTVDKAHDEALESAHSVDIKIESHFGSSRIYYVIQNFVAHQGKKSGFTKAGKRVQFCSMHNPAKDCSIHEFTEYRQQIEDSTVSLLNETQADISGKSDKAKSHKIYTMSDCQQILNAIPSSLLRSAEVYQAYEDLINAYVTQNTNTNPSSFKFDPEKINKKCSEKETKIKNKYLKPRLEALQNYLSRYKEIEAHHDELTDFEEKLSNGEITLNSKPEPKVEA